MKTWAGTGLFTGSLISVWVSGFVSFVDGMGGVGLMKTRNEAFSHKCTVGMVLLL